MLPTLKRTKTVLQSDFVSLFTRKVLGSTSSARTITKHPAWGVLLFRNRVSRLIVCTLRLHSVEAAFNSTHAVIEVLEVALKISGQSVGKKRERKYSGPGNVREQFVAFKGMLHILQYSALLALPRSACD